jgi:hypothetical protein
MEDGQRWISGEVGSRGTPGVDAVLVSRCRARTGPLFSSVRNRWVRLPEGWTTERLVELILAGAQRYAPTQEIVSELVAAGFAEDDGHLAIARTTGGLVRARTRDPRDAPSRWKDPIAGTSYRRALRDPGLAASLVPLAPPAGDRQ